MASSARSDRTSARQFLPARRPCSRAGPGPQTEARSRSNCQGSPTTDSAVGQRPAPPPCRISCDPSSRRMITTFCAARARRRNESGARGARHTCARHESPSLTMEATWRIPGRSAAPTTGCRRTSRSASGGPPACWAAAQSSRRRRAHPGRGRCRPRRSQGVGLRRSPPQAKSPPRRPPGRSWRCRRVRPKAPPAAHCRAGRSLRAQAPIRRPLRWRAGARRACPAERREFTAVGGEQVLVRGHHRNAATQGGGDGLARDVHAAHHLDDNVDVAAGEAKRVAHQWCRRLVTGRIANRNAGEREPARVGCQQPGDAATDRAMAEYAHAQWCLMRCRPSGPCGMVADARPGRGIDVPELNPRRCRCAKRIALCWMMEPSVASASSQPAVS